MVLDSTVAEHVAWQLVVYRERRKGMLWRRLGAMLESMGLAVAALATTLSRMSGMLPHSMEVVYQAEGCGSSNPGGVQLRCDRRYFYAVLQVCLTRLSLPHY